MITQEKAIELCKQIEPIAIIHGFHVALGGSVLFNGTSEKDIDIFIYRHTNFDGTTPTRGKIEPFLCNLTEIGFKIREDVKSVDKKKSKGDNWYKVVERTENQETRIDLIFLLPP